MSDTVSFQERRRDLQRQRAEDLAVRITALRRKVQRGSYDDSELNELAFILRAIRNDLVGNDTRLAEVIGLPGRTISQTYSGNNRPRFHNFMKMLHGADQILAREIQSPRMPLGGGEPFDDLAGSNLERLSSEGFDSNDLRIRARRSNIFLTENDLAHVQQLARASNTNISSIISEALAEYTARRSRGRAGSRRGPAELLIIENRSEIVRYSTAIIVALEEAVGYDPARHHNSPPPDLRLDDAAYLSEVRELIAELRRLNAFLERPTRTRARAARKQAGRFGKSFDKFLGSYTNAVGKGAAALTIAAAVGLLYQAGIGREIIDAIWQHARLR